ncbi:MAG: S8 family serine peptidase [Candidatus Andersenbacteria bacterium]
MNKNIIVSALFLLIGGLVGVGAYATSTGTRVPSDRIPGQYVVVLKDTTTNPNEVANKVAKEYGLGLQQVYEHALKGFAATIPDARLDNVKNDSRVLFVSEDKVVTTFAKPSAPSSSASQTLPTGVDRINAENKANKGTGVNVAVIDTGIDLKHPDLKANIVGGKNCSTGRSYTDGNGHGTHVAGTIAALNNSTGVVGVAPEAKLWAVRVLDNSGSGSWSSVICGIDFVTSKAGTIKVANMSLGGSGGSDNNCGFTNKDALHKAICNSRNAGVTYVVAAGNSAADASKFVPAAYDDAVITVSALADSNGQPGGGGAATSYGVDDTFASFSNYGNVVDLGAPGVNILSTWKGGGYNTISGTSMATPHVTGSAALYIAAHPGSTWAQVHDGLKAIGELTGFGHTDPSGNHPEAVVRADAL